MSDNNENLLDSSEKMKLQKIMTKLLSQEAILETLSSSEQKDLVYLLNKLDMDVNLIEYNPPTQLDSNSTPNLDKRNFILNKYIYIIPYIIIYLAIAVIPALIAFAITSSQLIASLIVIGLSLILVSGIYSLTGRISWGAFYLSLVVISSTALAFYFLLEYIK